jgi:hypothetical protein
MFLIRNEWRRLGKYHFTLAANPISFVGTYVRSFTMTTKLILWPTIMCNPEGQGDFIQRVSLAMTLQTWLQTGVLNVPSLIKSNSELLSQTPHFHTHSQLRPSLSFSYPFMLQFKNVWICFQDDRAMARRGKWASGSVERERRMGGVYKYIRS